MKPVICIKCGEIVEHPSVDAICDPCLEHDDMIMMSQLAWSGDDVVDDTWFDSDPTPLPSNPENTEAWEDAAND